MTHVLVAEEDLVLVEEVPLPVLNGRWGWLGLAAYVLAWDLIALRRRRLETLSGCFERTAAGRVGRYLLTVTWLVLSCHLFGRPRRLMVVDPISRAARALQGSR